MKMSSYFNSQVYKYTLELIAKKQKVCVNHFVDIRVNLCMLIGIKGRKQFLKVHNEYSSQKTYDHIC